MRTRIRSQTAWQLSAAQRLFSKRIDIYSAVSDWRPASDTQPRTEIVRIGYEDGFFTEGSTGSVSGELDNSFSVDEYDGNLHLVQQPQAGTKITANIPEPTDFISLMQTSKTIGKIENLADNEEIKSARFMGDTGYFVTYKNTDPLFSADLS